MWLDWPVTFAQNCGIFFWEKRGFFLIACFLLQKSFLEASYLCGENLCYWKIFFPDLHILFIEKVSSHEKCYQKDFFGKFLLAKNFFLDFLLPTSILAEYFYFRRIFLRKYRFSIDNFCCLCPMDISSDCGIFYWNLLFLIIPLSSSAIANKSIIIFVIGSIFLRIFLGYCVSLGSFCYLFTENCCYRQI